MNLSLAEARRDALSIAQFHTCGSWASRNDSPFNASHPFFIIKIRDAQQVIHSFYLLFLPCKEAWITKHLGKEGCPERLLFFRFLPKASSKGDSAVQLGPIKPARKEKQLAETTAQSRWSHIPQLKFMPPPEVQGYWDQMFWLTSLYIEGPSAKAQIWLQASSKSRSGILIWTSA